MIEFRLNDELQEPEHWKLLSFVTIHKKNSLKLEAIFFWNYYILELFWNFAYNI